MDRFLELAYLACEARWQAFEDWRGGRASYHEEEIPSHVPRVTNEELAGLELYRWLRDKPDHYFLYCGTAYRDMATLCDPQDWRFVRNGATNWTGLALGNVRFGDPYKDNFGGTRVPVTVYGNNGVHYVGTYYHSAGDYARIRKAKRVL